MIPSDATPAAPAAPAPSPSLPALPAQVEGDQAAEMTPEQQVEAIRRRIEARRAMRAQEGAAERAALERNKQVQ